MPAWTLLLSGLALLVAATLFAVVALRQAKRGAPPEALRARLLYTLWWAGVAVASGATALGELSAALGSRDIVLFMGLRYAAIYALCVALWGLMYFASFVLTGASRLLTPLAVLYACYYGVVAFVFTRAGPTGVEVSIWHAELAFALPLFGHPLAPLALAEAPVLLAAFVFLSIGATSLEPAVRTRIVLVGVSTLLWCVALVALRAGANGLVPLSALVVAGALACLAYRPDPPSVRPTG